MNRTTLITTASVGGVLLAGAALIGANFGILNAADASTQLGDLSAAAVPVASSTTEATAPAASNDMLRYQVADAGLVEISRSASGITFGVVTPAPGWRWTAETDPNGLAGTFSDGTTDLRFVATLTDGEVSAEIAPLAPAGSSDLPAASPLPTAQAPMPAAPATAAPSYDDDEHEDEYEAEHEDDDHDDDEYDDDEHEGREDDD